MSATIAPPAANGIASFGGTGTPDPIALAREMMPPPPPEPPTEEERAAAERKRLLASWVAMPNIAEDPDVSPLIETIASRVVADWKIDDNSRSDWKTKYREWLDFALQIAEQKTYPWPEACLSLDTDILTATGWKPVADIQIGEKVYSRASDGSADFYAVTERHRYTALSMVHFQGKSIDLMVTPNHRMLVESKFGKRKKQHFIEAGRFLEEKLAWRYIPLTSRWKGKPVQTIHGVDARAYARFIGWFIAQGTSIVQTKERPNGEMGKYPGSFVIAQSPASRPDLYRKLGEDIAACGFTCKPTDRGYIVHARSMSQAVKDELRSLGLSHQRFVPERILGAPEKVLRALLDGMVAGNGSIRRRSGKIESWSYYTISGQLADQLQEISQKIGWRATIQREAATLGGVINGRQIIGTQEGFTIQINQKARIQVAKMERHAVPGPCEVACVTVEPHHTLYVRRNGKALWCGNSNIIYPLMTVAAIQFAARAYPAIIRDRNVVKGVVIGQDNGIPNPEFVAFVQQQQQATAAQPPGPMGPGMPAAMGAPPSVPPAGPGMPPPGAVMPGMGPANTGHPDPWLTPPGSKQSRADRIGRHMSWQLLDEQEEWEPQTDSMLVALPIVGTYFRKTYYSPALRRNVSETVDAMALCVNYHAKSFETAPRHTEEIQLYPWEIEEQIRSGLFLDHDGEGAEAYGHDNMGGENGNDQADEDAPTTFLEQHRRWDLDDDGYAEPYIVTVARDNGKMARIQAGYDMEGVHWTRAGRVRKIDKIEFYTKYGFIPNPDSKVYDIGFGHLLYPINQGVNTTINMMFDAGHLQIAGGGFIGSGLSVNTGAVRFSMGEYKPVNTMGGNIRDNVFAIPFPGPNPVLFELLKFLIEAAERIAAVKDVMVGDMPGDNTSGITTLAVIEQGLKVFSAIYKRIHRSLGYEFKKLYRLNRLHGRAISQYKVGETWQEIKREDYLEGAGVEPISDPQMVTDMQRLGRAQFLLGFKDDQRVNGAKVILDSFRAAMIPEAETYMSGHGPAPDPKILVKNRELDIREKNEMIEAMIKAAHGKALIIKDIANAELFLAQARKLDNDAQLGWVEHHIDTLRAQVESITALTDAAQQAAGGASGQPAAGA